MDGICGAVMEKIKALGPSGRYFVVSADEFLDEFPEGAERSEAGLKRAIKSLCAEGYIDVKYSGGNLFCVAALKNYIPETPPPQKDLPIKDGSKPCKRVWCFWAAFLGGAAGGILAALASFLFLLC